MIRQFVILLLAFGLWGCATQPKQAKVESEKIRIMTMNVENLFDTDDDPGKNDESFLPLSKKVDSAMSNRCYTQNASSYRQDECLSTDWDQMTLERKMARLTDVLRQVNDGHGPDILTLQEVENINVLRIWRDNYLKDMNYQTMELIEGPDERGIDTAILSRLPKVGESKLHLLDYSKVASELKPGDIRPTRGILETHLRLPDGQEVAVFAVHFPSQGAPTIHRKVAVETLLNVTAKVGPGIPVIVGGDFNITNTEDWKEKYFPDLLAPRFAISHMVGCEKCSGTTYYHRDRTWSFFDVLLFSKDLDNGKVSGWSLSRPSIHIVNSSVYQINRWGSPANYGSGRQSVGVTDHWPMYAELVYSGDQIKGASR